MGQRFEPPQCGLKTGRHNARKSPPSTLESSLRHSFLTSRDLVATQESTVTNKCTAVTFSIAIKVARMADILPALAPPVGGPSQLRPYWPDRIRQRLASAVVLKANSPSRPIELDSKEKPDIEYYPHDAKYINRTASRLAAAAATGVAIGPTSVPNGWPASLSGPRVWSGEQYENQSDYVHTLSSAEKEEINAALEHFNGLSSRPTAHKSSRLVADRCNFQSALSLLPQKSNRQTFDLPSLGPVLRRLSAELHDGRGFVVVRGLDPAHYDNEENLILYLGISSWVGDVRGRQDNTGSMLCKCIVKSRPAQLLG